MTRTRRLREGLWRKERWLRSGPVEETDTVATSRQPVLGGLETPLPLRFRWSGERGVGRAKRKTLLMGKDSSPMPNNRNRTAVGERCLLHKIVLANARERTNGSSTASFWSSLQAVFTSCSKRSVVWCTPRPGSAAMATIRSFHLKRGGGGRGREGGGVGRRLSSPADLSVESIYLRPARS
jgi:hypothetical protein